MFLKAQQLAIRSATCREQHGATLHNVVSPFGNRKHQMLSTCNVSSFHAEINVCYGIKKLNPYCVL